MRQTETLKIEVEGRDLVLSTPMDGVVYRANFVDLPLYIVSRQRTQLGFVTDNQPGDSQLLELSGQPRHERQDREMMLDLLTRYSESEFEKFRDELRERRRLYTSEPQPGDKVVIAHPDLIKCDPWIPNDYLESINFREGVWAVEAVYPVSLASAGKLAVITRDRLLKPHTLLGVDIRGLRVIERPTIGDK